MITRPLFDLQIDKDPPPAKQQPSWLVGSAGKETAISLRQPVCSSSLSGPGKAFGTCQNIKGLAAWKQFLGIGGGRYD